jgi:hypothetical protein
MPQGIPLLSIFALSKGLLFDDVDLLSWFVRSFSAV